MIMTQAKTIELVYNEGTEDEHKEQVKLDLRLNPKKLIAIARDFPDANKVATMAIGQDKMELDMINLYKMVYVAYRQAHMNEYLSYSEFSDLYEFDFEEATNVYYSMLSKQYRIDYLQSIQKGTPKSGDKSKL